MQLIIVEDTGYQNFRPLTATRPVFDLLCGTLSLAERILRYMPVKKVSYLYRTELHEIFSHVYPTVHSSASDTILYINGRALADEVIAKEIRKISGKPKNIILRNEIDWVALFSTASAPLAEDTFDTLKENTPDGFIDKEISTKVITYPWDILDVNADFIISDFTDQSKRIKNKIRGKVHPRAVVSPKKNILIGKNSTVGANTVIDASRGPVIIEDNVTIEPHVYVKGPVWINSKSVVKSGARIYSGTSIGFNCRAAGEINSSILHSYSNKAHEGFLGHSYLGQWINIGADTNNSNLKNDYGPIRVMINGKPIDTGRQFFGMVMGDHSRTGINTMINTGTIIGVACNVFGANFPPKFLPDFSWGGADFIRLYQFDKFVESARAMTKRRHVSLSDEEINLLRKIYESREKK